MNTEDIFMAYLKRTIDVYLEKWKENPDHKPLIVKGARQIGKTESICRFGAMYYKSVIYINFVEEQKYKMITADGYGTEDVVKNISRIDPSKKFVEKETLIIFDEIQEFADIATTLKFFKLDGRYDVICSGSLLGINYKIIESNSVGYKTDYEMFSMSFEEFLWAKGYDTEFIEDIYRHMQDMTPLSEVTMAVCGNLFLDYCILGGMPAVVNSYIQKGTFEEFLWAKGYDTEFIEDIYRHMQDMTPLSEVTMAVCGNLFLDYCILGGMPAVVNSYIQKGTFEGTLELQRQLIGDYKEDVRKYADGLDQTRILNVFNRIPAQLAKENKKFQISGVAQGARFKDYRGCIDWLNDAGIINICYCLTFPELPLKGNYDTEKYKIYLRDTGLLVAMLDEEAQEDLRANKNLGVYKGALYENVVGEALVKSGCELYYYKREDSTLEEDFFLRTAQTLVPVEVKATDGRAKSLRTLIHGEKYGDISWGIKLCGKNIGFNDNVYTFPYFCSFLLKRYLREKKP